MDVNTKPVMVFKTGEHVIYHILMSGSCNLHLLDVADGHAWRTLHRELLQTAPAAPTHAAARPRDLDHDLVRGSVHDLHRERT